MCVCIIKQKCKRKKLQSFYWIVSFYEMLSLRYQVTSLEQTKLKRSNSELFKLHIIK